MTMTKDEALAVFGGSAEKARAWITEQIPLVLPHFQAVCVLALSALDDAGDEGLRRLQEDRATLLVAIQDAIDEAADTYGVQDWPPDTVLGESGVQAMQAIDRARSGLQVTLALPQFEDAERVIREERKRHKEWLAKRHAELKAKYDAKKAEPEEGA